MGTKFMECRTCIFSSCVLVRVYACALRMNACALRVPRVYACARMRARLLFLSNFLLMCRVLCACIALRRASACALEYPRVFKLIYSCKIGFLNDF
jgi:hypothetical protein